MYIYTSTLYSVLYSADFVWDFFACQVGAIMLGPRIGRFTAKVELQLAGLALKLVCRVR